MVRPSRNKRRFCECIKKYYKLYKEGNLSKRKNSISPYQTAIRDCTDLLNATGLVRCGKILKGGKKIKWYY